MIIFRKVRWKNLMSYGDTFTEIQIDRSPSTLITGENGSGKSTVCEAISYALFGKPFRKIKKGDLINIKNERGFLCEIEFDSIQGGKKESYLVRRGMKPDLFEIYRDDTLINENSSSRDYQSWLQTNVLKCDHTIFTQIVMIGQVNNVSFMRMKTPERRAFVETVLNLNVFTAMNKIQTSTLSELKDKISENKTEMTLCQKDINTQKRLIESEKNSVVIAEEKETERIKAECEILKNELEDLKDKLSNLKEKLADDVSVQLQDLRKKHSTIMTLLSKTSFKLEDLEKSQNNLKNLSHCSSCGQDVPDEIKNPKLQYLKTEIKKLQGADTELKQKLIEVDQAIEKLQETHKHNEKINREIASVNALVKDKKNRMRDLLNRPSVPDKKDPQTILDLEQTLNSFEKKMEGLQQIKDELNTEFEYHSLVKTMLQDAGIKATMIKKFIPIINACINSNLQKLGFFGKFILDENFEETIKSRGFDTLSYNSFSEGEKLRIDLAVLMAWRDVAKMQGIIDTNLFFFDEVLDASMDLAGTQSFASLLNQLKDSNIFIISHSGDKIFDQVKSQILFYKDKKGYSKMLTK